MSVVSAIYCYLLSPICCSFNFRIFATGLFDNGGASDKEKEKIISAGLKGEKEHEQEQERSFFFRLNEIDVFTFLISRSPATKLESRLLLS